MLVVEFVDQSLESQVGLLIFQVNPLSPGDIPQHQGHGNAFKNIDHETDGCIASRMSIMEY